MLPPPHVASPPTHSIMNHHHLEIGSDLEISRAGARAARTRRGGSLSRGHEHRPGGRRRPPPPRSPISRLYTHPSIHRVSSPFLHSHAFTCPLGAARTGPTTSAAAAAAAISSRAFAACLYPSRRAGAEAYQSANPGRLGIPTFERSVGRARAQRYVPRQ